eukprot:TRINITY_DN3273_c0_g2_i1.p1 TRINITY_DN3273_c0_g2~~TRINITY_DN3273_c0_g2_i1.p1  ORF type:complete len:785 (+),score=226.84 TRINITY_DN3273_c0_g2_i1:124-2478(+)
METLVSLKGIFDKVIKLNDDLLEISTTANDACVKTAPFVTEDSDIVEKDHKLTSSDGNLVNNTLLSLQQAHMSICKAMSHIDDAKDTLETEIAKREKEDNVNSLYAITVSSDVGLFEDVDESLKSPKRSLLSRVTSEESIRNHLPVYEPISYLNFCHKFRADSSLVEKAVRKSIIDLISDLNQVPCACNDPASVLEDIYSDVAQYLDEDSKWADVDPEDILKHCEMFIMHELDLLVPLKKYYLNQLQEKNAVFHKKIKQLQWIKPENLGIPEYYQFTDLHVGSVQDALKEMIKCDSPQEMLERLVQCYNDIWKIMNLSKRFYFGENSNNDAAGADEFLNVLIMLLIAARASELPSTLEMIRYTRALINRDTKSEYSLVTFLSAVHFIRICDHKLLKNITLEEYNECMSEENDDLDDILWNKNTSPIFNKMGSDTLFDDTPVGKARTGRSSMPSLSRSSLFPNFPQSPTESTKRKRVSVSTCFDSDTDLSRENSIIIDSNNNNNTNNDNKKINNNDENNNTNKSMTGASNTSRKETDTSPLDDFDFGNNELHNSCEQSNKTIPKQTDVASNKENEQLDKKPDIDENENKNKDSDQSLKFTSNTNDKNSTKIEKSSQMNSTLFNDIDGEYDQVEDEYDGDTIPGKINEKDISRKRSKSSEAASKLHRVSWSVARRASVVHAFKPLAISEIDEDPLNMIAVDDDDESDLWGSSPPIPDEYKDFADTENRTSLSCESITTQDDYITVSLDAKSVTPAMNPNPDMLQRMRTVSNLSTSSPITVHETAMI